MSHYFKTTGYILSGSGVCERGFDGPFSKSSMTKTMEEIAREKD